MLASDLRELADDQLLDSLDESKQELFNLRFQFATGQLESPARITKVKRDIARINTVLREREIAAAEAAGFDGGAGGSFRIRGHGTTFVFYSPSVKRSLLRLGIRAWGVRSRARLADAADERGRLAMRRGSSAGRAPRSNDVEAIAHDRITRQHPE